MMTEKLKNQQEKLIINERHEAWGSLARKLAHEIKNPLTPIQLTIDRIRNKFSNQIESNEKDDFKENLKIINNQIKQIEKLVNEFSDFARMPKPILRKNNLIIMIKENLELLKQLDNSINFNFLYKNEKIHFNCDKEQLNRVFFNLIKNSIESIQQKAENGSNFEKSISIELIETNTHITIMFIDSGMGFEAFTNNIKDIVNPYFTTKKNGTGLGLSIVNKIVSDHIGNIDFIPIQNGAKIKITFAKNDS